MRKDCSILLGLVIATAPGGLLAEIDAPIESISQDLYRPSASRYSSFDLHDFKALTPDFLDKNGRKAVHVVSSTDTIDSQYNLLGIHGDTNSILIPLYRPQAILGDDDGTDQFQAWGVKWHHRVNTGNSFAVSAHMGESNYDNIDLGDTTSSMAALAWTTRLSGSNQPSLTGSVFFGDENASDENALQFDRKYYGFTVGGQLTVYRHHTPYVSFKLQRSEYIFDDALVLDSVEEDSFSRLSAGWNWQLQSNWSLKAEANYVWSESELDWRSNRSKLFFGTRYDFR